MGARAQCQLRQGGGQTSLLRFMSPSLSGAGQSLPEHKQPHKLPRLDEESLHLSLKHEDENHTGFEPAWSGVLHFWAPGSSDGLNSFSTASGH